MNDNMNVVDTDSIINYLAFLMADYRPNLIGLLNKYGYAVGPKVSDSALKEWLLIAIAQKPEFVDELEQLMLGSIEVEQKHLNRQGNGTLSADGSTQPHQKFSMQFNHDNTIGLALSKFSASLKTSFNKVKDAFKKIKIKK